MRNRILIVVGVVVVAATGGWWLWHRRASDSPATATVTQPQVAPANRGAARASEAPASLAVTVSDDKGPLAGATVRIAPDEGEVQLVATGVDGIARASGLAAGDYRISASAPAHQPAGLARKRLAAGEDAKLTIALPAGGRTLSGTVSDVSGGPIAGARVDAARLDKNIRPSDAVAAALTGADGKYQLTVAEGQLLVAVRSAEYAPQTRYVEVGPSGATADFALVPGGVIEGVVRDERTKQPVAGAAVVARRDAPRMLLAEAGGRRTLAGADGKFRIAGLPPGAYNLLARAGAQRTKTPALVGIGVAEQVTDVELLVGTGPVVRGKVVDEANAPVAGARVMMFGEGGGEDATADTNGAFVLEGLTPGRYALFATSDSHLPAGDTRVELVDKDLDGIVVRVRAGAKLAGHVEPRQVCDVRLEPDNPELGMAALMAPTTTAADGVFTFAPVANGKATIAARCPSGAQGEAAIAIASRMIDVIVKVTPGGTITGRVVDAEGKPVPGVAVNASPQTGGERTMIVNGVITSGAQALTTAAGTYELTGLGADTYRLGVLDRGRPLRMRGKPPKITLAAAEKKTGVELAVDRPNGVIKGVVTGPDGAPLADAWVSVQQDLEAMLGGMRADRDDEDGDRRMMTVERTEDDEGGGGGGPSDYAPVLTDAQGRFAIGGLPHTAFDVIAEAQSGKLRGRAANVTPDATVNLQALGLTTLSGTVRGPKGPPALFAVELEGPTEARRSFTEGTFALGRVDPGTYIVRVTSADGNGEGKVTVEPNRPASIEIALTANAMVVGTLVDGAGKPVAGLPVTVIDDTGNGRLMIRMEGPAPTSGPDGKFRVEHKAGLAALVVLGGTAPVIKRGLELEAGKPYDAGAVRVDAGPPPKP